MDRLVGVHEVAVADGQLAQRVGAVELLVLEKPVGFYGLGTKGALEKLDREYRETCRKAGEVPLDLAYEVPAGDTTTTDQFVTNIAKMQQIALRVGLPDDPE